MITLEEAEKQLKEITEFVATLRKRRPCALYHLAPGHIAFSAWPYGYDFHGEVQFNSNTSLQEALRKAFHEIERNGYEVIEGGGRYSGGSLWIRSVT